MNEEHVSLSAIVHGESGSGKSWVGDTAKAPRLILDAEGGSQYTPSKPKQIWDPRYAPPGVEGCVPGQEQVTPTTRAMVRDFGTMQQIYRWLESGQHFFKSVVMDSLTEIQKRCKDTLVQGQMMQQQDWGKLLDDMELLVRQYRDLTFHPTTPVEQVIVLALTHMKDGKYRPAVQGALNTSLPGFVDVVGYLYTELESDGRTVGRRMLIQPMGQFSAKDRTDILTAQLGAVVPNPNFEQMLGVLQQGVAA